jgi:hypothetical protein
MMGPNPLTPGVSSTYCECVCTAAYSNSVSVDTRRVALSMYTCSDHDARRVIGRARVRGRQATNGCDILLKQG